MYIFIACKVNVSTQVGVSTESSCQMQYLVWTLSPFGTPWFHFDGSSKHLLTLKQTELPFFCLLPTDLLPPEHSCHSILRCTRMEWIAPRFCVHWLEKLWFENPKSRYQFLHFTLKMVRKLASSDSTSESQRLFEPQLSGSKVILPHFHQRCHCPPDANIFLCRYHTCFASFVFLIFHRTWATWHMFWKFL